MSFPPEAFRAPYAVGVVGCASKMRVSAPIPRFFFVAALIALVISACGSRSDLNKPVLLLADGGIASCGDGACAGDETCSTCSVDCGLCTGCGDGSCTSDETCASCPQDCGVCTNCGDGFCKEGKTCLSCAPDCGKCPGCGDGVCDARTENCFTCPDDCGKCKDCGDGKCTSAETCASCPHDCGVCAVCGNMKCEAPYETCSNCHEDCGDCATIGCFPMLTCSFGCIDPRTRPPTVKVSCVGNCVARGCPSAQFFFDQAFNCFLQHLQECGANFGCLQSKCGGEVTACLGSVCRP